jgi:outer membrane biosynthesis protein TonB
MRSGPSALAATLLVAACAARQPPVTVPAISREGETSVRVLTREPDSAEPSEVEIETITPVYASEENALPEYPAYALEAGCDKGIVPIRVSIGADGKVQKMEAIPAGGSPAISATPPSGPPRARRSRSGRSLRPSA